MGTPTSFGRKLWDKYKRLVITGRAHSLIMQTKGNDTAWNYFTHLSKAN